MSLRQIVRTIAGAAFGTDREGNPVANRRDGSQIVLDADASTGVPSIYTRTASGTEAQYPGLTTAQQAWVQSSVSGTGTVLLPTGSDDSAILSQFVQDMAASGFEAKLGAGDFIIGSPMTWRCQKVMAKWGSKGIGLRLRGQGPGNTRLLWSPALSTTTNMITVNSPSSAGIGARNYLTEFADMSLVRAPGGTEVAAGTVDGNGFYGGPSAAGEVFHTTKFRNMVIDGFNYPMTLSDCTLAEFDTVWWPEFLVGIRLGFNVDILKIRHSMFGSEQFGVSYRNNAIAVQNGFSDGFNTAGSENIVEFDHVWFMKIGCGFEGQDATDVKGVRFNHVYFEEVREYYRHLGATSKDSIVSFKNSHFSKPNSNDTTQNDPLVAGYQAKINFGGDVTVSGGKRPVLTMEDCTADAVQPANAWISFNHRSGNIVLQNMAWRPSASFGHVRCIRTPNAAWRSVPADATSSGGLYVLGDSNQGGIGLLSGTPVEVSATITAASTYQIDCLAGDTFYLTLPDGDCTIDVQPYAAVAPNRQISPNTKFRVVLIVPASVAALRTITWASRMKMNAGTLTYTTTDANKRAVILLQGYANSGSGMQLVSPAPAFVA